MCASMRIGQSEDRDDARGRGARTHDPQREAGDGEAGGGQLVEVDQPLDLRVGEIGLMRRPEDARLVARERLGGLHAQRAVPAPGVDAHHAHAPVVQPAGRLVGDAGPTVDVVGLAVELVAAGAHEHDVARLELVVGGRDGGLHLLSRDCVAVRLAGEIDADSATEEPLERKLVDRRRRRSCDRRVVVVGGVDVGRVVRAERHELARPALAVAQEPRRHAVQRLDLGCTARVVDVLDRVPLEVGRAERTRLDRRGEVDDARH